MLSFIRQIKKTVQKVVQYFWPRRREEPRPALTDSPRQDIELGLPLERLEATGERGYALVPQDENLEQLFDDISVWDVMSGLSSMIFTKENTPRIVTATMLTGMGTGLNFLSPYLFGEMFKLLSSEDDSTTIFGLELSRATLLMILVTSHTLSQVLNNLRDQIIVPVTSRNTKKILELSTEHMLRKSLDYHVNTPFTDINYRMQKCFSIPSVCTPMLTQIAPTTVEICIACGVLASRYGLGMGVGLMAMLAAYTGYGALTASTIIESREVAQKTGNAAYENFTTAITQYKVMRDTGKHDYTMKGVSTALENWIQANIRAESLPLQIGQGHFVISRLSMLMTTLFVGLGVKSGQFTVQEFVMLFGYFNQLATLLPGFGLAINQLFAAYPDLKLVFGELAKPDELIDLYPDNHLRIQDKQAPMIEFENISFSYPQHSGEAEKPPIFQNLSFTVLPGQTVALVSESGAGKSTAFNLLKSYYLPSQGCIKINGQDISQVSQRSLENCISLIGQDPNLFKGSVRQNICFGAENPDAVSDDEIWTLARRANLYEFLQSLPKKLQTDVGEAGRALSGGQQQKVAILRGLFKTGSIRLLDEVTAALDSKSATQVMQSIHESSAGKTTLMITHKLTETQAADKILVIDAGRVVAQGTHQELLDNCALYQRLWQAYTSQDASPTSSTSSMLAALGGRQAPVVDSEEYHVSTRVTHRKPEDIHVIEEEDYQDDAAFKMN